MKTITTTSDKKQYLNSDMKKILLICCFCYLLYFDSLGQKVTYKDLIGTAWSLNDTSTSQSMAFKFIDSTRLMLSFSVSVADINTNEKDTVHYSGRVKGKVVSE